MPPENTLSEDELLAAIKHRYNVGAELLYDRYAAVLYKVIFSTVKDRLLANAVLEQALIVIWNSIDDFEGQDTRLLLWMSAIARKLAKDKQALSAVA